jgi:integrase/recombinase XerD
MARSLTLSQAFQGMILEKRAAGLSPHTISDYQNTCKKVLLYFTKNPVFTSITREQLVKFFAWLRDDYIAKPAGVAPRGEFKLSPKSRLNIHTNLSALWSWAIVTGYARTNIVRTIPAPEVNETEIEPLSLKEIEALLKACDTAHIYSRQNKDIVPSRHTAARDRMIIMLLFDTGLRAQELCDLMIKDLNIDQNKISIRHGKGDKARTVHFGRRAAKVVWEYLKDRLGPKTKPTEPLLLVDEDLDPRPMNRHVLGRLVSRIGDRAGVKKVHPHRFRHSFAIEYLRNDGKMLALQDLLGHSDLETARRYARFVEADIAIDHASASPADKLRL